jgi:hypothetical protein
MRRMFTTTWVAGLLGLPLAIGFGSVQQQPKLVTHAGPLPIALNKDFQFRKTKLYLLAEQAPGQEKSNLDDQTVQGSGKGGKLASTAPSSKTTTVQDASIRFERQYHLFGAVTKLDQRERMGNYLDFFWRARRTADLTVRLEYKQEKLHAHVQAQEIYYQGARGTHKASFKVVGDDYFDDGRVIAWRCLLIENGQIVAETHSYLWQ